MEKEPTRDNALVYSNHLRILRSAIKRAYVTTGVTYSPCLHALTHDSPAAFSRWLYVHRRRQYIHKLREAFCISADPAVTLTRPKYSQEIDSKLVLTSKVRDDFAICQVRAPLVPSQCSICGATITGPEMADLHLQAHEQAVFYRSCQGRAAYLSRTRYMQEMGRKTREDLALLALSPPACTHPQFSPLDYTRNVTAPDCLRAGSPPRQGRGDKSGKGRRSKPRGKTLQYNPTPSSLSLALFCLCCPACRFTSPSIDVIEWHLVRHHPSFLPLELSPTRPLPPQPSTPAPQEEQEVKEETVKETVKEVKGEEETKEESPLPEFPVAPESAGALPDLLTVEWTHVDMPCAPEAISPSAVSVSVSHQTDTLTQ
eukprot:gnl/Dysnectes_brevis/7268_a12043_317.p1 GENE.gnl/Dysnectes_brevis/7268_a12043_317~~gnl/Dysnectes_brevis/7268_a12043_317.p1  ORF type:complete len:371 (-),score=80.73 gnl/Dysnectes_brevis/7268_a12043_317:26-1138(-)